MIYGKTSTHLKSKRTVYGKKSETEPIYISPIRNILKYLDAKGHLFIYQDIIYQVSTKYSVSEASLLIIEEADKERIKFEKIKIKYLSNDTEEIMYSRIPIAESVRIKVWQRDLGKCVSCGSKEKLEYDHIIPVSKGGSNTIRNIQILCENCNRTKSNQIK